MIDMYDDIFVGSCCGYVVIVGCFNVGKFILFNYIFGQKLVIILCKLQIICYNMFGIKIEGEVQVVYVDMFGLYKSGEKVFNCYMNCIVSVVLKDVDVVIFVVDCICWIEEDQMVLECVQYVSCLVLIVVNKIDCIEEKVDLLLYFEWFIQQLLKVEVVLILVQYGINLDVLEKLVVECLLESEYFFFEDQIIDCSSCFLVVELVCEKIMCQFGVELFYQIIVEIEEFKQEGCILYIYVLILVECEGQKKIIIGDKGEWIKSIGQNVCKDMEVLFDFKVMFNFWVKVKGGWFDDECVLCLLGYGDF